MLALLLPKKKDFSKHRAERCRQEFVKNIGFVANNARYYLERVQMKKFVNLIYDYVGYERVTYTSESPTLILTPRSHFAPQLSQQLLNSLSKLDVS